jgi:feruloyl esterase
MSTNSGHTSAGVDADWALNNTEAIVDWAHRGIHLATVYSKEIVRKYYESKIDYSYYTGCSSGGRQGLKEVGLYPDDFDGAVIGAPAWRMSSLAGWITQLGARNLPQNDPGYIPAAMLSKISEEQIRQCDPMDGGTDGIIMDAPACKPCLHGLLCSDGQTTDCLTTEQFKTLSHLSINWTDDDGALIFPALEPGATLMALAGVDTALESLGTAFFENIVVSVSNLDWRTFDLGLLHLAEKTDLGETDALHFDF